jgi:hypothetical protein
VGKSNSNPPATEREGGLPPQGSVQEGEGQGQKEQKQHRRTQRGEGEPSKGEDP